MSTTIALHSESVNQKGGRNWQESTGPHRLTVNTGETTRLPDTFRQFRVLAGCGWMSANGEDRVLQPGDVVSLTTKRDFAVLTVLGTQPIIIETPETV